MSGDQDDPLFSQEMVLSRLYFNDIVWRALTTAHEVVHSACVTSSAKTKILMESSMLLRKRSRSTRARAAALRKELGQGRLTDLLKPVARVKHGEWL